MTPGDASTISFAESSAAIVCPVCQVEMWFAQVCGIKVVACRKCLGTLYAGEAFAAIVRQLRREYLGPDAPPQPLDPDRRHQVRNCPACGQTMDNHPYSGPGNVIVDACRHCFLTWLDADELARIVRAPGRR